MNKGNRMLSLRRGAVACVILLSSTAVAQQPAPPVAKVKPRVDTLHGEVRLDKYAWMRNRNDPDLMAWLEAENGYTDAMTRHTAALQEKIYQEIVARIKETDLSVPEKRGPYFYYSRTEKGKSYPIFCRRRGSVDGPEEVIFDQNAMAEGKKFYSLGGFQVSPDHRYLAVLVDTNGYEDFELQVKDLTTGRFLPDRIEKLSWGLAWASDNRTIFYMTPDSAKRGDKVWRHRLGDDRSRDVMVYHEPDVLFNLNVRRARSGKFIYIESGSFTSGETRVIDASKPASTPRLLAARRPGVEYDVTDIPGRFLILTNDSAPNFRVMQAPTARPGAWKEFLAHRDTAFVENVQAYRDFVVISERSSGLRRYRVHRLRDDSVHYVTFPEPAYGVFQGGAEYESPVMRFSYSSLVTPSTVYDYDMRTRERREMKRDEVLGGYDPSGYAVERLYARARDGTRVPISLVYRKPFARDGSRPLFLYAYGSYGSTTEPTFNSTRLSLIDRGFVFAIAHVRGGQEMGRSWYDDGKMMRKKNTFTDFIDVAEHLVNEKYTAKERLVANGGSAGGLLMGVVTNMRPDLFRAVVADVPFVDVINTMADASIPLTAQEWQQWGNPHKKDEYAYMLSYSPYDNVERKDYPALLVTSGLNDSRVAYWEPSKWVAKLREMKTDRNPLLLKMNMGAGHGGSSGRYERYREIAFRYAFVVDAVGLAVTQ
jgi:oligopeptidase B